MSDLIPGNSSESISGSTTNVVTAAETVPAVSKPAASGTNYEAAYKGLQSTYQKLKLESEQLTATYNALLAEHEQLKQDHQTLQGRTTTLEGEARNTKVVLSRTRLIMSEFGDLTQFETQGLLPQDADEAALRTKLGNFRAAIQSRVGDAVKQQVAGSVPGTTPPASSQPVSSEDEGYIWDRMSEFAGRDDHKYLEWRNKWDAIQASKLTKMR